MHDGCSGSFTNGAQIVDKLRMMGFSNMQMPVPAQINCAGCGETFTMETMEARCPTCNMVYGVTPCHASSTGSIQPAGIDY
ncbi:MAG: hypothetical protein C0622_00765 [Desulfuromonas sp.]|nr:MAG: hypothetical protein C0622_00765 [Desulfuromonas sp.]